MTLPRIPGETSVADFQAAFKALSEKTTSSLPCMHYSIWKLLTRDDSGLAYFVSEWWTHGHEVDVMTKKKKDMRKTHQLKIIGILEADFDTAHKNLFAKK